MSSLNTKQSTRGPGHDVERASWVANQLQGLLKNPPEDEVKGMYAKLWDIATILAGQLFDQRNAKQQKQAVHKAMVLPLALRNYTEPKGKLADKAEPAYKLQAALEQCDDDGKKKVLRDKLGAQRLELENAVQAEIWSQLNGGGSCEKVLFNLTNIMAVSNARFCDVYGSIVVGIKSDDPEAFEAFSNEAKTVMSLCAESCRKCRQPTEDAVEILDQAMRAGTFFEVRGLAAV